MEAMVKVGHLPKCDFCGKEAHYDGKTSVGQWAYMCEECFVKHGLGLGTGIGQKLVIKKPEKRQTPQERTRNAVYATGNKWAIENFEATHN